MNEYDRGYYDALKWVLGLNEYDRGYCDALEWVYEHTGGDNYKLSVKAKMQDLMRIIQLKKL